MTAAPADPDLLLTRPPAVAWAVAVLLVAIELTLQGADLGWWGSVLWRPRAYQNGALWAGLVWGWRPNFAAQPVTMFVTHAWLHGGLGHVAGNVVVMLVLAGRLAGQLPTLRFLALWVLSGMGGGLVFALISSSAQPMVGASGALFGLVGAALAWEWQSGPAGRRRAALWALGLVALNLAFWLAQGGVLAWEAHLGGALTGLAWGATIRRVP